MKRIKWKNYLNIYIIFILLIVIVVNYNNNIEITSDNINLNDSIQKSVNCIDSLKIDIEILKNENDSLEKLFVKKYDLMEFFKKMSFRESGGDQWVVNSYNMMGLYQFNMSTLHFLGMNYTQNEFLSSVDIQNQAMLKYLKFNRKLLNGYIDKYDGEVYKGIYITASGILAGAHLTGPGGIISFFEESGKYSQIDGNGVHVSEYIEYFSGYDILMYL